MITLVRGTDPRLLITLQQKDSCGEVRPVVITNSMVITFTYRDLLGIKNKTIATGVSVFNASLGKIVINFTDVDTTRLKLGVLDFDIVVDEGPERLIWRFFGQVTVQSGV